MREAFPRVEPRGYVVPAALPVIGVVPMNWAALSEGECPTCGHDWGRGEIVGAVAGLVVCALCLDFYRVTGKLGAR